MQTIDTLKRDIDNIEYMLTICNSLAYKDYKELLNDKYKELLELTLLQGCKAINKETLQ